MATDPTTDRSLAAAFWHYWNDGDAPRWAWTILVIAGLLLAFLIL
jgi:hypothetical protein